MSNAPDARTSSLDPDLLRILEAAEAGLPSPLLDDDPLVNSPLFDDNASLVHRREETRPAPAIEYEDNGVLNDDSVIGEQAEAPREMTRFQGASDASTTEFSVPEVSIPTDVKVDVVPVPDTTPAAPISMEDWLAQEPPLTQDVLDGIFADAEHRGVLHTYPDGDEHRFHDATLPPESAPSTEDVGAMSQTELDALLLAGDAADTAEDFQDDASMSQAELDALLASDATDATEDFEDNAPMSQAELDALLASDATDAAEDFEDNAPMSQADLDALLLAGEATEAAAPVEDDAPMSQAELDALLNGISESASESESVPGFDAEAPLSQDDLDALINGIEGSSPGSAPDARPGSDQPLNQDDLDALISGLDSTPQPSEPPVSAGTDAPLSQADLDALLSGMEIAPKPVLLPAAPAAPAAVSSNDLLSQADLDALLNGLSDPAPPPPAADPGGSLGLSQADLDALIASAQPAADNTVSGLSEDELAGLFDDKTGAPVNRGEDSLLDQNSIDALLTGQGDDQPLDHRSVDAPLLSSDGAYDDDLSLSQSSIDALMADLDRSGAMTAPPPPVADDDDPSDISQDMIDALIASAQAQSTGSSAQASASEVGSENLAAAATASDGGPELLSQSDLDRLIEESRIQDKARNQAKQRALEEAINAAQASVRGGDAPDLLHELEARKPPRKPSATLAFLRENGARVAASLLMGGLAALGTGVMLHLNREVIPVGASPEAVAELEVALERAREELGRGDYPAAIAELERPLAVALPGSTRNDALYVMLEARYRAHKGEWGTQAFDDITSEIDRTVEQAPTHPRAPEALAWRAELFKAHDPNAALDTYQRIIDEFPGAENLDRILSDASKLALAQNDPLTAAIYAQDLLQRFPASPFAGEAILTVGDANRLAGNETDARATYVRIAQSEPDTGLGAQAFLRLGRLAYDNGDYAQAIMQLEKRLDTTTTEGNDEVYLLLAQSFRKAGKLNEARDTLSDLLNIFEPSAVTPQAYIEFSQVLDALGERDKAVRTAQRAAMEYPENPAVLRNSGELFGLAGNPLEAAGALVKAEAAGAADPNLLLTAARYYRAAGLPDEAARTYERIRTIYGASPAALTSGVEAAQLRYAEGDPEGALEDLKTLQDAARGTEQYLAALEAMQEIYRDLGLTEHVRATGREIIQQAGTPDVLAQTALTLLDSGDLEGAQKAIEQLDLNQLKKPVAFDLLMKEGRALLSVAPLRALEKMEAAHFNYPEARTREADQLLLETYLATDRPAAARRLVMDLKAAADQKPSDVPYLVDAAITWGDYLYNKEDYRTAAFAYTLAEDSGLKGGQAFPGLRTDPEWARYQRANALLRLGDYQGCLTLFDEIASSESPWAGEAGVKANLARLEQRQRGVIVPPPPARDGARAQAG